MPTELVPLVLPTGSDWPIEAGPTPASEPGPSIEGGAPAAAAAAAAAASEPEESAKRLAAFGFPAAIAATAAAFAVGPSEPG